MVCRSNLLDNAAERLLDYVDLSNGGMGRRAEIPDAVCVRIPVACVQTQKRSPLPRRGAR